MLENHLYDKHFFNFVTEVVTYCCVESLDEGVIIAPNADKLTEKEKAQYTMLTDFIIDHIFKLLTHAHHNDSIMFMRDTLLNLFSLVPENAEKFLWLHVWQDDKLEIIKKALLKSSEAPVRICVSRLLSRAVNIVIKRNGF